MNKTNTKKRALFVDILLLTTIFSIFLFITFIVFFNKGEDKVGFLQAFYTNSESNVNAEIYETNSMYASIKIASEISNDLSLPYAIQYPITSKDELNKQVKQFVQTEKQSYINEMNYIKEKYDEQIAGELNISFDIFQHQTNYFSFLFHTIKIVPGQDFNQPVQTFFFAQHTGKQLLITDVLQVDDQSLQAISSQVQLLIEKDKRFSHINKKQLKIHTTANWKNYEQFTLTDEAITFYFNNLLDASLQQPLTITLSLASINPFLKEDFQIKMLNEEEKEIKDETKQEEKIEENTQQTKTNKEKVKKEKKPLKTDAHKYVALTFDDGPHQKVTPEILKLLKKYDATATFFMLGSNVKYNPEIAKSVYKAGHEIGNHTWSHPVLTNMNDAQILKEYTTTQKQITKVTGQEPTIFRPPYGATNKHIKTLIPIQQYNWTVDTEDWKYRDSAKLLAAIKEQVKPDAVILMHDIHDSTAEGLEDVLIYLQKEGYEFLTLSELLATQKNKK